jgi:TRAP transporter TAXI family solute receptor
VAESASALKDRKIDAFFWVGGLPTAAVSDLANSPGVKIRMIDIAHLVPAMTKKHGNIYIKDVIEKSVYKGMETDNQAATVTNLLVVHQNMDDKTAYNIVKAVFDHRDELIRVHKEAENIKLENQKTEASSIPWHPGAIKFFAEKGVKIN